MEIQAAVQTPTWFSAAIDDKPEHGQTMVDSVPISFRHWGESSPDRPDIVLVHGAAAQGAWWDHVGPLLAGDRRVTAVDLSGHGDSGWRPSYDLHTWGTEVMAAGRASSPRERPILIGHSMGGEVVLHAAGILGSALAGAIIVDPLKHDVTSEDAHARTGKNFGSPYVHASQKAAARRFRVIPAQSTLPYVCEHIGFNAVREVPGGWTWKYDPRIVAVGRGGLSRLGDITCPLALVHPEHGLADPAATAIKSQLTIGVQIIEIPAAAHHVMLDEPLSLISCLRTLLSCPTWAG